MIKQLRSIIRQTVALTVVISMIATVLVAPSTVFAFDNGNEGKISAQRANLSFIYVGKTPKADVGDDGMGGDDLSSVYPTDFSAKEMDTFEKGDYLWAGVQVSKLSVLREELFKSSGVGTGVGGLAGMTLSYRYDSRYLEPYVNLGYEAFDMVSSNYPNIYTLSSADINAGLGDVNTGEDSLVDADNLDEVQITFGLTGSAKVNAKRMFHDTSSTELLGDENILLMLFPFKIKDVPAGGTKVLQGSLAGDRFTMSIGHTKTSVDGYQWEKTQTGDSEASNLKNYFNITDAEGKNPSDGEIPVFPATYTVDFYNDSTLAAPVGTQLSVKEKETVAADKVPAQSDFTPPTGQYFDKLQYFVDADGTGTADSDHDPEFVASTGAEDQNPPATKITGNTKVYAKYKDGHKVNFHSNYGSFSITSPPSEKTKVVTVAPEAGQVINESDKPTVGAAGDNPDFIAPTGWSLVGWYTDQACTAGNEFNFETATGGDGTKINGTDTTTPTELYAKWAQEVTYTFDQNYTGAPANTTVKKTAGEKLGTDAPTVTRDKYDFKEWNTKSNGSGDSYTSTTIADLAATADTTLYAIWTPKSDQATYTLTFDAVGGTLKNPTSITVVQGDPITQAMMPDDPEKTGATGNAYTFDGWFKDASPSNTDELTRPITLTEDTTAYAHWSYTAADKITITFDDQGATTAVSPTTIDIAPGDAIGALPTDPAKDGNSFSGWYPNADGTGTKVETTTTFSSNTTVYAKWAADVNYTFDYNYDGAPAATTIPQKAGTALGEKAPADPTRTDYDFKGWDTASNGTGTRYADQNALKALNEASDLTLYAIWDAASTLPPDQKATITFHSSVDGLNVTPPSITVKKGDKLIAAQLPTPTRTDYELEGWYDKADVTGTKVTDTDGAITVADDMNAYAHWTYTGANPVTVTFNAPDSDGDTHTWTVTIGSGDKVGAAAPAVTKTNNTFKAWEDETDQSTYDPANDAVTANKIVKATWTENITIKFDANTGNGTATDQVGKPTDKLALPADGTFTKPDYKLVGWNTAKNGSGAYVNNTMDLDAVKTAAGAATSTITLYAQWADATITNPDPNPPTPPTPDNGGVLVKFDTNAAGSANQTGVVDAKPNWKIPKLGDAIGADQMPTDPVRPHYVLKTDKWNTKPDGSGVNVDGTTAISSAALGDALVDKGNGTYEVTLYAQWDIDPSVDANDKIKVKFNDNEDGKGKDDNVQEFTIFRGDSIGFDLPTPADTTKAFEGWFEGTAGDGGVISFTGDALTKTTPINPTGTEVTYYAKSKMYLWVELQVKDDSNNDIVYTYDGNVKDPTYKVWAVVKPETGDTDPTKLSETPVASGTASALAAKGINITYEKSATTATLRDAGTYSIKVGELSATSELGAQGASVALRVPDTVTINAKGIDVTLDPAKQEAKKTSTQEYVKVDDLILADGALINGATKDNVLKVTYKLWTDSETSGTKGVIDDGELGDAPANTLDIGTYVMEIGTADSNYAINSVASSVADKTLVTFDAAHYPAAWPDNKLKTPGTNLQFKIVPNDPKATDIKVTKTGSTDALTLTTDNYATPKPFMPDDTSETSKDEYWVRVDNVTDSVDIHVTNESYFTAKVDGKDLTDGKVTVSDIKEAIETNEDGTPKKDENGNILKHDPQVVEVVVSNSSGDTKTYKIHVQRLGARSSIEMNPGNSPYGLMERMAAKYLPDDKKSQAWDAAKIKKAKEAFNNSNAINKTYGKDDEGNVLVPIGGQTDFKYITSAWEKHDKNYDMVDEATFVYEASTFTDPGFTVYDQAGEIVLNPTVNKTLTVRKIDSGGVPTYEATEGEDRSLVEQNVNGVQKYSLSGIVIRPNKYEIEYSYTYTDLADGQSKTLDTVKRPLIILSKRGDVQLTTSVLFNSNDAIFLQNTWSSLRSRSMLFSFRTADIQITSSPLMNSNDAIELTNTWATLKDGVQFYTTID